MLILNMRIATILIVFILLASTYVENSKAANLSVCNSGCPHSTIQSAVNAASSGDIITVQNGSYSGFTVNKQVTVTAANYNQNDPSQNTVQITGSVVSTGGSNWAWNAGPVVRGFKIHGPDPVSMVNSPMTIEYNYITGTSGDNVSFEGGGGIVRGNYISSPADDNIDADKQSKDILIENNYLYSANEEGIEMRQHDIDITQRATVTIRNNIIKDSPSDGFQLMDYNNFSNRRYVIERNLFINNELGGIAIMPNDITRETLEGAPMPEAMYIINNTFVNNGGAIAGGANAVVVNNIFSGSRLFDIKNVNGKSVITHNLFSSAPKLQGTNNFNNQTAFTGNPQFSQTHTLLAGSAAIDKGISQLSHSYSYDGSGGGSAQTYNDVVLNLTSGQYRGSAPDLGMSESGLTATPGGYNADVNSDGRVDIVDIGILIDHYARVPVTNIKADINRDGRVDIVDIGICIDNYGR
jgi:hypothetical protein